jgi:hypothetical protein
MRHRVSVKPWLWDTHNSFAIVVIGQGLALIWTFIEIYFGGHEEQWHVAALKHTNQFLSPHGWGAVAGVIGLLMLVGLYRPTFRLTRFALFLAFAFLLVNTLFLAWARIEGEPTGWGLQLRAMMLVNFFVQAYKEPPLNPANQRKD